MITIETLCIRFHDVPRADVERWIQQQWVRPEGRPDRPLFRDIDVARVALIRELRNEMQVNEDAMPVVLRLLDQLYAERRRMRRFCAAVTQTVPEAVQGAMWQHLQGEE